MSASHGAKGSQQAGAQAPKAPRGAARAPFGGSVYASVAGLQHSAGNAAVSRLLQPVAGDERSEAEAERWARGGSGGRMGRAPRGGTGDGTAIEGYLNRFGSRGLLLPQALRTHMERRFAADFAEVQIHADQPAASLAGHLGAQAFTFRNRIYFAAGRFSPDTPSGHILLAHELAHVLQQRGTLGCIQRQADPATSEAIPAGEQKKIKIITNRPVAPGDLDIDDLFGTATAKTTYTPPAKVVFAADVTDANLQRGLRNAAALLTTDVQITPVTLDLNSSITVALDLTKYKGGDDLYRFTYYKHTPDKGKAEEQILVERLGARGGETLSKDEKESADKTFQAHKFTFQGAWKDDEKQAVLSAVRSMPDSLLSLIDGVTFARAAASTSDPKAAGEYDMENHTIKMFDKAFAASRVRFGTPAQGTSTPAVFYVTHEIGHAIDRRRVRAAMDAAKKAQAALDAKFGKYKKGDEYKDIPGEETEEFNKLLKAAKDAEAAVDKATTESGHKFDASKALVEDPKATTDFRKAAAKDGGVRISPYSDDAWEEFFAESFAAYIRDPKGLERLRPSVYAYFVKNFPK